MSDKRKYGFKGKYCTLCNSVWELIPLVGMVWHPDLPSYGLERENCSKCGGTSAKAQKPSTLADKAAEQRNLLFNKENEKRNK